jgi:hypothetical protein
MTFGSAIAVADSHIAERAEVALARAARRSPPTANVQEQRALSNAR